MAIRVPLSASQLKYQQLQYIISYPERAGVNFLAAAGKKLPMAGEKSSAGGGRTLT
jgi:hypothetical protein